jgi:hypothetical protein
MTWPIPVDNVTFWDQALAMINKGFFGPVFNVKNYGAVGTYGNTTDSTAAFVNCHADAQAARGVTFIPPGHYRYSAKIFDVTQRCGILGAGGRLTFLQPLPGYTDYAITFTDCWRNGTESAVLGSQTLDIVNSKAGCFAGGFAIFGDRTVGNNQRGIATIGINDFLYLNDISLCFLDGKAFSLGNIDNVASGQVGTCRESRFTNIIVSHCGNLSEPAVDICGGTGVAASDGVNDLYWQNVNLSNNRGVHLRIAAAKASASTRGILFENLIVNGDGPEAPSPTPADLVVVEGAASCELRNYMISGSATVSSVAYAAVRIKSNASGTPDRVELTGDIVSVLGDGYVIDALVSGRIGGTSGVASNKVELRVGAGAITSKLQYDVISQASVLGRQAMIVYADEAGAFKVSGAFRGDNVLTAVAGDTAPDVKNVGTLTFQNPSPTMVTNFRFGGQGQVLRVEAGTSDTGPTTLQFGANLITRGGVDRRLQNREVTFFIHDGSVQWSELAGPPLVVDGWLQDNVAANQNNVELTRAVGRWRAVRAGSVVGLVVTSTLARTNGTLTVKIFKNTGLAGAAGAQLSSMTAVLDATNTSKAASYQRTTLAAFALGDEIYATVTTDAPWAPTTAGIRVAMEILT